MKKIGKILLVVICFLFVVIVTGCGNKNNLEVDDYSQIDLENMVSSIYSKVSVSDFPDVQTASVNVSDTAAVKIYTSLEDTSKIDMVVESEPVSANAPYSLVLIKTKDNANIEKISKEIADNFDISKIGDGTATNLYVNSYGRVIMLVVSTDNYAKPVYESFKTIASENIGKEYTKVK